MTTHVPVTIAGRPSATPATPAPVDPDLMRLFSEPLRAQLVTELASRELCTCDLADVTGALPSAVSNHLRRLREAGVVEAEPKGRYTVYRLRPEILRQVADVFAGLAAAAESATSRDC